MNKDALKSRLLELTRADFDAARKKYEALAAEARVDGGETIERDQQSQAEALGELAAAWDEAMHDDEARIARLNEIDFGPTDTVGEGAAVLVDERLLIVSVSTPAFEIDGKPAMGISPAAPIYKAMKGLKIGDVFAFNGKDHEIKGVY